MQDVQTPGTDLPSIPVVATGPDFAWDSLIAQEARAHALLDEATRGVPASALRVLDATSRRWLAKWANPHLAEIDRIADRLARPGAYFLSVNYEWGCTVGVRAAPDGHSARLVRVLDWRTAGLGRYVTAIRVAGATAPFVTLAWPGYTGVLQGMAPGRFAAALNQAPMPKRGGGVYPLDWAANKLQVWRSPHGTPGHVLRQVFEQAPDYATARQLLRDTPMSSPAIFSLAGMRASELCVIERSEVAAHVHDGPTAAANAWLAPGWRGRERGSDSAARTCQMQTLAPDLTADFSWLAPPILNDRTRLVMIADAAQGRLVAQGYEADGPATEPLHLHG